MLERVNIATKLSGARRTPSTMRERNRLSEHRKRTHGNSHSPGRTSLHPAAGSAGAKERKMEKRFSVKIYKNIRPRRKAPYNCDFRLPQRTGDPPDGDGGCVQCSVCESSHLKTLYIEIKMLAFRI